MKWQDLLDHLITVEGECIEENYGKGRALNEADEEVNAGIRQGYAELLQVRSTLMAAPEMLAALKVAERVMLDALRHLDCPEELEMTQGAIAKAEGRSK